MRRFKIHLGEIHEKSGLTAYAVARDTGLNENTVRNYVGTLEPKIMNYVHYSVVVMADFYGIDWRDVVEVIEEDESSPEINAPLLATA